MSLIEVINLQKIYRVGDTVIPAVTDVSLTIKPGEFVSIVGHSGSGKTTLVSIIGGILRPTGGQVLFDGNDICSLDDNSLSGFRSARIGFMFQFASLMPVLTARENVQLPGLFNPGTKRISDRKAVDYLSMVGIGDKSDSYPPQLSGGQQRRVAIARALINDPEIILADEPTGDLDEETERETMELFWKINREHGVTIILITHNLELAQQAGQQIKMGQGRLID